MTTDLDKLNSLTKYPSIPTYHALGEKGRIAADAQPQVLFCDEQDLVITEKVDGCGGRVIVLPDRDWLIGSREELLTARGDRIPNSVLRIVEALQPLANIVCEGFTLKTTAVVMFAEVYGGSVTKNSKQYTQTKQLGYRVFDIAYVPLAMLDKDRAEIASWRDHGGQRFVDEAALIRHATTFNFALTPRWVASTVPPDRPTDVATWLYQFRYSQCVLDTGMEGAAEGVVVRTPTRSKIAKIRFDDYKRSCLMPKVSDA